MKILTEEERHEVLARMTANAIIAEVALRYSPASHYDEGVAKVEDNLKKASYIIGGEDALKYTWSKYIKEIVIKKTMKL